MTTATGNRRVASGVRLGIGGFGHEQVYDWKPIERQDVVDLLDHLNGLQRVRVDHNPRTAVMVADEGFAFRPGGGKRAVEIDKNALPGLFDFIKLPDQTAENLPPALRSQAATALLASKDQYEVRIEDGKVVSFGSRSKGDPIRPKPAVSAMEKGAVSKGQGGEWVRAEQLGPGVAHLELMSYRAEPIGYQTSDLGDLLYAGADILVSPPGLTFPEVDGYGLRKVCGNGSCDLAFHRQYRFHGNEGDDVFQWFRQSVRDAVKNVQATADVWRKLHDDAIEPEQRPMVVEALIREAGIPVNGPEAEAIRAMAMKNPPQTGFDAANLMTFATSHFHMGPNMRRRAQQKLARAFGDGALHSLICPACNQRQTRRTRAMMDAPTIDADSSILNPN